MDERTSLANLDLTLVYELIWRLSHALKRPLVQVQLFGIVISLVLGWLISQGILILWRRRFLKMNKGELHDDKSSFKHYATDLLHFMLTPVLSLMAVSGLQTFFIQQGWRAGLIN